MKNPRVTYRKRGKTIENHEKVMVSCWEHDPLSRWVFHSFLYVYRRVMDWFKGTFILQDTMDLPNKEVSILQVFRSTDPWIKCIHRSFQPPTAGKRLVLVELLLAEEVVELLPECSPRQKAISYPCNSWPFSGPRWHWNIFEYF